MLHSSTVLEEPPPSSQQTLHSSIFRIVLSDIQHPSYLDRQRRHHSIFFWIYKEYFVYLTTGLHPNQMICLLYQCCNNLSPNLANCRCFWGLLCSYSHSPVSSIVSINFLSINSVRQPCFSFFAETPRIRSVNLLWNHSFIARDFIFSCC